MIAKIIVHGKDRMEAISIMKRALSETVIEPLKTTIPFNMEVLNRPRFVRGKFTTAFIEQMLLDDSKAKKGKKK